MVGPLTPERQEISNFRDILACTVSFTSVREPLSLYRKLMELPGEVLCLITHPEADMVSDVSFMAVYTVSFMGFFRPVTVELFQSGPMCWTNQHHDLHGLTTSMAELFDSS